MPHLARDMTMQFGDRITSIGISQGKDAHAEHFTLRHLMARSIKELIACHFELRPECSQIFLDQPERELIVTCSDRCMGCENILCARFFKRLFEGMASFNHFTGTLKGEECGMALIHMPDRWVIAQCTQGTHAANAEQKFLHHAAVQVRPVEP